ncbi:hypothetical protein IAQ61_006468, partial [Plenodomus lingam]|uniref:uncharacterized protein n=1 Tax=Leptosphaeria maculans TaxID=5022 RepID=UPI003320F5A7
QALPRRSFAPLKSFRRFSTCNFFHRKPLVSHIHPKCILAAACTSGPLTHFLRRTTCTSTCLRLTSHTIRTTSQAMARKRINTLSDSSLTPLPDNVPSATDIVGAVEPVPTGKKRKATAIVKTPAKRAKKVVEAEVKAATFVPAIEDDGHVDVKAAAKKRLRARRSMSSMRTVAKRKLQVMKKLEPLAERTQDTRLRVGAHISAAGGVHNSLMNVLHIGGNAFALFLKQHRKWDNSELDPKVAQLFIDGCKEHSIDPAESCLPHGSYLVNLAHPDPTRKKQAYDSFLNDLKRCNKLGIRFYNFHPGNANAGTREEGIRMIAQNLNEAHRDPETGTVITLLETMATLGNTIGGTFADLASIIQLVEDKSRVGVCLDTCHVFAAGYDLRTSEAYAATMEQFDEVVGLEYLKAFHVNDSKAPLFSNRDLHARIGTGYLGLRSFHNLVNDTRFHGLPMVLETPNEVINEKGEKVDDKGVWAREIKLLERLVGMDAESDEFKKMEARLQEEGDAERKRVGEQVDRKNAKAAVPKRGKGKGKKRVDSEGEDD